MPIKLPPTVITSALQDAGWLETAALPYRCNPWRLVWDDIQLFCSQAAYLPYIVWPVTPFNSGALDELYPSPRNLFCISVHLVLCAAQLAFIVVIPAFLFWPAPFGLLSFVVFVFSFLAINQLMCSWLLNGKRPILNSQVDLSRFPKHDDERWIFLNGVAVGSHWLQSNIDRIALSFGRPVIGVHNPT